ncbi:MAG TPA: hypothetical protein V6D48_21250 [Oculatellaceae cyanobacterium]
MKRFTAVLLFSAIAFSSTKTLADTTIFGVATNIRTFTGSSDVSRTYAGFLNVTANNGTTYRLYWGGSNCSQFLQPSSNQLQMMSQAVAAQKTAIVDFKVQGSVFCLTGFGFAG